MLKIQKNIEYALLALRYIYQNQENKSISSKEISETLSIPYELLSKILQRMVKSDLISSQQGKYGGYTLNELPDNISFGRVISALDQKVQLTDCMVSDPSKENCKRVEGCCLRSPLSGIQDKINDLFNNITLNEILN
ncbi:MAG: Rrf2 family transcriptional regulator [Bacteroidetes bacterium]|nr:Rrf2 family transcriptional regulator [Bacteroidota bacterium]